MVVSQLLELTIVPAALEITPMENLHSVQLLPRIYSVSIVPNNMRRRRL